MGGAVKLAELERGPIITERELAEEGTSPSKLLVASGFAAVLSCTCCLGPLLLVTLGVTGTWMQRFARLEPYRPALLSLGLLAFAIAGYLIFRKQPACSMDGWCAHPRRSLVHRISFVAVAVVLAAAFAFPYLAQIFC